MCRVKVLVAAVATAAGLAVGGAEASAAPPVVIPQPGYVPPGGFVPPGYPPLPPGCADTDFVVYVRYPHGHHWHYYGKYETRWQAERVERMLARRGEFVRVVPVRDFGRPW